MTLSTELTGPDYAKLVVGGVFGFIIGFLFSPHHQDKSSRVKAGIYEIVGILIGIALMYGYITLNK